MIAVDDGAFTRRSRTAPLVAVVVSLPDRVEGVHVGRVTVDGSDATDRMLALLAGSPHLPGARALLLDGISYGGFNLVDLSRLNRELRIPVVAVTRRAPDYDAIRFALAKYFPGELRRRYRLVRAQRLFQVRTPGAPILAACVGATQEEVRRLLAKASIVGYWPEPLRLAHLIARAIGTSASRQGSQR
ncbi:MAG: DUF99 family protein [Thermoplasmata archaeon]|nr:DUF99 family protein [Thermoplasmata archaeon]